MNSGNSAGVTSSNYPVMLVFGFSLYKVITTHGDNVVPTTVVPDVEEALMRKFLACYDGLAIPAIPLMDYITRYYLYIFH